MIGIISCFLLLIANIILECSGRTVTYPGIGTFTDHDFYDIKYRPFVIIPDSPEEVNPTFLLYNRNTAGDTPTHLKFNQTADYYKSTNFNPKLETKFIVHGFSDNSEFGVWMKVLKDNFLKLGDFNVIIVDWKHGDKINYVRAVANTRIVGAMMGVLIKNLCKSFNITEDLFHLTGHSLGAHIVGYAGKFLDGKIGHITGFDPAGPLFEGLKFPAARLWHTDAKFVEAIHTDAHRSENSILGFGMYENCGHVDIYPNGGFNQPGCNQERFITIFTDGFKEGIRKLVSCDHCRSIEFYIESILNTESSAVAHHCPNYQSFLDGKCANCNEDPSTCIVLGPEGYNYRQYITNASSFVDNRFFMVTAPHKNFFRFQYLIKINISPNSETQEGTIDLILKDDITKQEVAFFKNKHPIQRGNSYPLVTVLDINPQNLNEIIFKWTHGLNWSHLQISVDSIEIVPLSGKKSTKVPERMTFKTKEYEIMNGREIVFSLAK